MDVKAFPALIVGVVVALVLAGAVLPVFAETTSATDTFKNEGLFYLMEIDGNTDITLEWDHTDPTNIKVGDKTVSVPQNTRYPVTVICSDSWGLRYLVQNDQTLLTLFDTSVSTVFNASSGEDGNDMIVTITGGVATFDNGLTTAKDEQFTKGYCITDKGAYVMKNYSDTAYLVGDSVIFATGRTSGLSALTSPTVSLNVSGTIDDGVNATSLYPQTYTTSNVTVNYSEVNNYIDLYSFTSVQFTVNDASDHSANATYNQVIVPYEVTAKKAVHPDGALSVMLNVLPLLAIAGLVTGAVVWFIHRKG